MSYDAGFADAYAGRPFWPAGWLLVPYRTGYGDGLALARSQWRQPSFLSGYELPSDGAPVYVGSTPLPFRSIGQSPSSEPRPSHTTILLADGSKAPVKRGSCASVIALKQMLSDLGYPVAMQDGMPSGHMDSVDHGSLSAFALSQAMAHSPGDPPSPQLCDALADRHWATRNDRHVLGLIARLSTGQKLALGAGVATLAYAAYRIIRQSLDDDYTPNRGPLPKPTKRRRITKSGDVIVRGQKWGRRSPPKKYRKLGATAASDYAWPEDFMYPVRFHKPDGTMNAAKTRSHIIAAKAFFTRYKNRYPAKVRRTVAKNINAAAKWYNRKRPNSARPLKAKVTP